MNVVAQSRGRLHRHSQEARTEIHQVRSPSGVKLTTFFSRPQVNLHKGSLVEVKQPTKLALKSTVLSPFKRSRTSASNMGPKPIVVELGDGRQIEVPRGGENETVLTLTTRLAQILLQNGITQRVLGFETATFNKNILMDYYLTLPSQRIADVPNRLQPVFVGRLTNPPLVGLRDFQLLRCIGLGGFSRVFVARKVDDGRFYALKLIEKSFITQHRKQIVIEHEREILGRIDSSFLTTLHYAFESVDYVAFVMEYCSGGELFYHLRQLRRLNEDHARFYFVQICLAVKYLHSLGVLYRDIKPENILMSSDGYLQISDFGLSKPGNDSRQLSYSFCGSPEYMAPEMLKKQGHNYMVDCYCLGALLYEFITGLPPFYSRNTDEIYQSILTEELVIPPTLPAPLRSLLSGLLKKDPKQRLGSHRGVDEILDHEWTMQIDIERIKRKELPAPYLPEQFRFNFDEEDFEQGNEEFLMKYKASLNNTLPFQPMFQDFYLDRKPKSLRQISTKSSHNLLIRRI